MREMKSEYDNEAFSMSTPKWLAVRAVFVRRVSGRTGFMMRTVYRNTAPPDGAIGKSSEKIKVFGRILQ